MELSPEVVVGRPRRHSYPVGPQELSGDNKEREECLKPNRSASLETSPMSGIRLGSKVAKEAAKSFWNMDMLHESLEKMREYAVIESSSLGSSIESGDESDQDDPFNMSTEVCQCLSPIAPHLMSLPFSLTSRSTPPSPKQSPSIPRRRAHSEYAERKTEKKSSTIPRKITPAKMSPKSAAKVRFFLTGSSPSLVDGDQEGSPRDHGFYEP